ncbi:hypothetical protein GGU11DRAFT_155884 [Lentinula aff. detonsa]|uniref:J domain-containing protein n=1 Tax=Lentinula aff. detonsa TaxID=2804958 RepID=A0AA38L3K0_9AGAR|nr:hypothetical protein GGU10DRAFT_437078 [Lentinula aff. detonsa]KAJ3796179.1 hypothetical protein GGU11DRAFT_155884 [Lentinula aff. detonsa]
MFRASRWKTIHRLASLNYSTKPQSFPFPKQANPTPHQIFHLPPNASQDDIKNRYYELVRIYHPDKARTSLSSEEAHARFRSISHAYNILRGKSTSNESSTTTSTPDGRYEATTAARRAAHVRRHRELYEAGAVDDRWKDRIILFGVIGTVVVFVVQAAITRHDAVEEVMDRARLHRLDAEISRRRKTLEDPRLSAPEEEHGPQEKH